MAFTKNYLYSKEDQKISFFARAISHPARIAILRMLYRKGVCDVETLSTIHPLCQPSISQHLRILRKAHLVACKEKSPHTFYSLENENFDDLLTGLKNFIDQFK